MLCSVLFMPLVLTINLCPMTNCLNVQMSLASGHHQIVQLPVD